jgi:hypothetical protein
MTFSVRAQSFSAITYKDKRGSVCLPDMALKDGEDTYRIRAVRGDGGVVFDAIDEIRARFVYEHTLSALHPPSMRALGNGQTFEPGVKRRDDGPLGELASYAVGMGCTGERSSRRGALLERLELEGRVGDRVAICVHEACGSSADTAWKRGYMDAPMDCMYSRDSSFFVMFV